jgi:hypothetical protein
MSAQHRSLSHTIGAGPPTEACEWGNSTPEAALVEQSENKVDAVDTQVDAVDAVDIHGSSHGFSGARVSDRDTQLVADEIASLKDLKASLKAGAGGP